MHTPQSASSSKVYLTPLKYNGNTPTAAAAATGTGTNNTNTPLASGILGMKTLSVHGVQDFGGSGNSLNSYLSVGTGMGLHNYKVYDDTENLGTGSLVYDRSELDDLLTLLDSSPKRKSTTTTGITTGASGGAATTATATTSGTPGIAERNGGSKNVSK
jgi:hypothetical protein